IEADTARAERAAHECELIKYRRGQIVLARQLDSAITKADTELEVGSARESEMQRAAAIYCAAFDIDKRIAPVFASLYGAPRFEWVDARDHGEVVCVGLLCVGDVLAYRMGGATTPAFRGMGGQAATFAERFSIARVRGCKVAVA